MHGGARHGRSSGLTGSRRRKSGSAAASPASCISRSLWCRCALLRGPPPRVPDALIVVVHRGVFSPLMVCDRCGSLDPFHSLGLMTVVAGCVLLPREVCWTHSLSVLDTLISRTVAFFGRVGAQQAGHVEPQGGDLLPGLCARRRRPVSAPPERAVGTEHAAGGLKLH